MQDIKLIHATTTELKMDTVTGVRLASFDNNLALYGCSGEVFLFELNTEPNSNDTFPYGFSQIELSTNVPCARLIKNIDISCIYANCSVQEAQELALEPVYVSECSGELPAKVALVEWAPGCTQNERIMLAILSTAGFCQLLSKAKGSRNWQPSIKVHDFFYSEVFPLNKSLEHIKDFSEFKALIDLYWITALAWCAAAAAAGTHILYTGNAAGFIVAFRLSSANADVDAEKVQQYFKCQTSLGRITYIKCFDKFLLIGNQKGAVHLYKVEHGEAATMAEVECLWSRADRMVVHKAEVTLSPELNSYLVVFTKAAHVLAYRLTLEGHIMCNATLYVGGISITGLQMLADKEFIIASINGTVKRIRVASSHSDELSMDEQIVETDIDVKNMQILGVTTTYNRNLWPFLLHRNKQYAHQSKHADNTMFISIFRLSTIDSLTVLSNLNVKCMDAYVDYVVAIRIDVLNCTDTDKYNGYYALANAKFPKEFNDAFLQKLQIKLHILKAFKKVQRVKLKFVKNCTCCEYDFVLAALQITHILCRLQYLQKLTASNSTPLQPFQQLAANCMRAKCRLLIAELADQANDENPLKHTIERFRTLTSAELTAQCSNGSSFCSEQCLYCDQKVDVHTMLCPSGHKVGRCCVSYAQVPLFNKRYCGHCKCPALEDDALLQQLFASDEPLKCTYCRFSFINSDI